MRVISTDPKGQLQEIFNFVRDHLLKQKEPAKKHTVDECCAGGLCAYRGVNGRSCAVGCLLPDELADKLDNVVGSSAVAFKMGSEVSPNSYVFQPVCAELGVEDTQEMAEFLYGLQNIHDNNRPSMWAALLTEFANSNNLQP